MQSDPPTKSSLCIVLQVWEGRGVVATGRKLIGATNPAASEPGTIRGDYAIEVRSFLTVSAPVSVSEVCSRQCVQETVTGVGGLK